MFQSTRPRGARLLISVTIRSFSSFNPRARAGRDGNCKPATLRWKGFNPRARAGRDVPGQLSNRRN